MVEALKNDRETRFKDTDDRHILIGAAGSNLTEEEAAEWKQMLVDAFPDSYVYYDPLSFSIGCHIGRKDMEWVSVFVQKIMTTNNVYNTPRETSDMLPSYRTMKYKSPIWGYFHVQKE